MLFCQDRNVILSSRKIRSLQEKLFCQGTKYCSKAENAGTSMQKRLFRQGRKCCPVNVGTVVLSRQEMLFCQGKKYSVKAKNSVLSRQEMLVFQSSQGLSVKARNAGKAGP